MADPDQGIALSEHASKRLLQEYGIPVTREELCPDPDEAVRAAERIGFPVALKGCGPTLQHKSEGNWIALDLRTPGEVHWLAQEMLNRAEADLEGLLVQEMVPGDRELALGLIRDPQFGPCVMLGLGGVYAQALGTAVFRMAPLCRVEVEDMISEFGGRALLGAVRGHQPVDSVSLAVALTGLGRLGLELGDVIEVDVNPLIIGPDGSITAADALVVMGDPPC